MKQPTYKPNPSKGKVKSQQAELIYGAMNNGNGNGNDNNNGNNGNGGDNGNGNDKDKNNNGNGNDKDKNNNGNGNDKDKNNNGNGKDNKDLTKEERNKKKEEAKKGLGYKQKGKYNNRGKHLGWYKNRLASGEQIEVTYYLNDVSDDLGQVLMTYNDDGVYDTAYTYGTERIGIDILDGSRPDAQNPLYYLYDGLGSVSYITKPDGEIRDTYQYDEFGKPKSGKLSPDGDKILHTSFGYTGEQWDEESQLQYLRARYYDPEVGRFINRDTYQGEVENPISKNLYAYVQNNPVNSIDPSGHKMYKPGYLFKSTEEAAKGFGKTYNLASIKQNKEYFSFILVQMVKGKTYYVFTSPKIGTKDEVAIPNPPKGRKAAAIIHTHAAYDPSYGDCNDTFSDTDMNEAIQYQHHGIISYLVTPAGYLKKYYYWSDTIVTISRDMPRDPKDPKNK